MLDTLLILSQTIDFQTVSNLIALFSVGGEFLERGGYIWWGKICETGNFLGGEMESHR